MIDIQEIDTYTPGNRRSTDLLAGVVQHPRKAVQVEESSCAFSTCPFGSYCSWRSHPYSPFPPTLNSEPASRAPSRIPKAEWFPAQKLPSPIWGRASSTRQSPPV